MSRTEVFAGGQSKKEKDDKEEAVRRLRNAEASLRDAIQEVQKKHKQHEGQGLLCNHPDSCVANAIGNLCQSFLLAYGVRVGIGILLRAFNLAKGQSYRSILDLKLLVSEKDLIVREEACRVGLLFGGFTGSYHAIRCLLRKTRRKETPLNGFLAGSVAGLSVLALDDPSRRRTLALYLLTRLAQCAYNSAKSKNKFHLWGSSWSHGDSLLFAIASAQAKAAGRTPEDYEKMGNKTGASILGHYNATLKACNALDYHDFISYAVKLLKDYSEVFEECQKTWTAILVDEFQDTSSMQYCLLKLLSSHNRITVVGDDDQSIFSFNGADISGFDSFRKDFPSHKEVRLHQNYRSTRCIVEAASSLIRNNVKRCPSKHVFTDNVSGDKIIIRECRNEDAQCAFVVDNILMATSVNSKGERSFANIAILYRRQVSGKLFQSILRARKIPFNVHGVAFYRKKVIKAVISMLQTALSMGGDGPFRCVFKALYPGDKEEKKRAIDYVEKVANSTKCGFLMAAREIFTAKVSGTFNRRQLAQGRRVLFIIDTIYKLVRKERSLSAIVTSAVNFIPQKFLFEKRAIIDEDSGKFLNEEDDPRSVLEYLLDDVSDFLCNHLNSMSTDERGTHIDDQGGCVTVLKVFLDYLSAREMENFRCRREHNRNSVTLTTMHQSKGLEWDTVFIVKTNDSEIPLLHESMGSVKNGGSSLEEERRLFYVAMTRARKNLYISYVVMDSNFQLLQPSRFLKELPCHLIDIQAESLSSRIILETCQDKGNMDRQEAKVQKDHEGKIEASESREVVHNQILFDIPKEEELDSVVLNGELSTGSPFLKGFSIEARPSIAALFHTWAKKRAFHDPKRLLDKVGFVIDERIRNKTCKNKDALRALKCCLKDDEAVLYAEHVIKWEKMPPDEKALVQAERQEHFQRQGAERAMVSTVATAKQIAYLQSLGCTITPTSRLHASRLIEQYKSL